MYIFNEFRRNFYFEIGLVGRDNYLVLWCCVVIMTRENQVSDKRVMFVSLL